MKTENVDLMKSARESLKGKWGLAIGTFLVYILIAGGLSSIKFIGPVISLFISGPLALGIAQFSLSISRDQEPRFEQLFKGFENYKTALVTYLLVLVFILLWTLLLIVPGIIAALSYSLTFYIIADDGAIEPKVAMERSKQLMDGYKLKLFYLWLRILGLALLCVLTLGIGLLWLLPFAQVTMAKFYEDVRANPMNAGTI